MNRDLRPAPIDHRPRRGVPALLLALSLAGCAASPPSSPSPAPTDAAWRSMQAVDPARSSVGAVNWSAAARDALAPNERLGLEQALRSDLEAGLRSLPAEPRGRAVRLDVTVDHIEPVSPALNLASALVLFVPLDRGGAALELVATDEADGAPLATLRWSATAPLTQFGAQFERLGPAAFVLGDAARHFVRMLGNERAQAQELAQGERP